MEVHNDGSGKCRGGVWANGNLHLAKAECGLKVYCNAITSGPLQGVREEAEGTGGNAVVVTGGYWPIRGKGHGGGGGGVGQGWSEKRVRGLRWNTPRCGTTAMDTK